MQQTYDAVVVGSGATGGWVAKQLTEAGLDVAVLEAGRRLSPTRDYSEHTPPHEMPFRGRRLPRERREQQPVQSRCYQCDEYEPSLHRRYRASVHHPGRPPLRLDPRSARRRQVDHVGPPVVSPQRL